jgi:putative addiction module component (TIGR02574 family)
MTTSANRILQDALSLSDVERAEIATRLIESLSEPNEESTAVEKAWAEEIERRCAALDAGTTGTTSWQEIQGHIQTKILRK